MMPVDGFPLTLPLCVNCIPSYTFIQDINFLWRNSKFKLTANKTMNKEGTWQRRKQKGTKKELIRSKASKRATISDLSALQFLQKGISHLSEMLFSFLQRSRQNVVLCHVTSRLSNRHQPAVSRLSHICIRVEDGGVMFLQYAVTFVHAHMAFQLRRTTLVSLIPLQGTTMLRSLSGTVSFVDSFDVGLSIT